MPQASDEDRARMVRWFGEIDDSGPSEFLISHGFTMEVFGFWSPPTPAHNISQDEWRCLAFLRDEWDYDYSHPLLLESEA